MNLENDYYIYFNGIDYEDQNSPRLLIRNQLKINTSNNIPIYNKDYIISENYVRGYNINNLPDNFNAYENNLLWNNIYASTMQIELPLYDSGFISRDLLFFWDWGVGWDSWTLKNSKIRSYGIGIRYDIMKIAKIDICIGMTPYNGDKELQVIVRNF
jgi:outer membrane protein assembly factor BamA